MDMGNLIEANWACVLCFYLSIRLTVGMILLGYERFKRKEKYYTS